MDKTYHTIIDQLPSGETVSWETIEMALKQPIGIPRLKERAHESHSAFMVTRDEQEECRVSSFLENSEVAAGAYNAPRCLLRRDKTNEGKPFPVGQARLRLLFLEEQREASGNTTLGTDQQKAVGHGCIMESAWAYAFMSGQWTLVHVLCINGDCRWMLHLDNFTHWNYEGEATCPNCRCTFMVTVKDGQVMSATAIRARGTLDEVITVSKRGSFIAATRPTTGEGVAQAE